MFYDQFEYCIGFYLEEASCLRILNHAHVDEFIERRKQWREIAQQRWVNGVQKHGIIMSRRWKEITEKTVADLHALTEQLLLTKSEFKLVVSVDQGYIYSNDVSFLEQLSCMPELNHKTFTQATVTRPKNTIQLKNPQHQFRTYLKLSKLTVQQKDQLENFLSNQQSQVRLSPGLKQWVNQPFNRLQDYFFIDHDSQTWLTMLGLVVPGIVRKTMHIIVAK